MSVHTLPLQDKISAELECLQMLHNKTTSKGGDDHMLQCLQTRQKGLLRKFESEQAEIHRLQCVQSQCCTMLRQHREITQVKQHREIARVRQSASSYRNKLRRYQSMECQSQPSPTLSPTPSDMTSQVRVV